MKDRYSPLFDAPVIEHYRQAIAYAVDKKMIQHSIDFDPMRDERFVATALRDLALEGYWQPWRPDATTREAVIR